MASVGISPPNSLKEVCNTPSYRFGDTFKPDVITDTASHDR